MAARTLVTGNLGNDPRTGTTKTGKPYVSLSIGCTAASKDRDTGQWSDDGDPLWIGASFFDGHAGRLPALSKGDKVTVEGDLVIRSYTDQSGMQQRSLELRFPRFLGVIPKQQSGSAYGQPAQATYNAPANDVWGTPNPAYDVDPPF